MRGNKNYLVGRNFEYKLATFFRRKGFFVVRSAGSHGVADLVAHKKGGKPLFIQAKAGKGGITVKEQNELFKIAFEADAIPIVALKEGRTPIVYKRIIKISVVKGDAERIVKGSEF